MPNIAQPQETPRWIKKLPNQLTFVRILCIPFIVVLMIAGNHFEANSPFTPQLPDFLAATLFAIASITDILDGWVARKFGVETLLGKLLDPLADKLLVVSALIILVDKHRLYGWIAVILIVRDLGINAIRIASLEENLIIPSSWLGKTKTILLDIGIGCLAVNGEVWGFFPARLIGLSFVWAALFASVVSAAQYLWNYARMQPKA